jgi:cephalosporin hydroxylase
VSDVVNDFHTLYYDSSPQTWEATYWLGVQVLKCPLDLWIYQELLHRLRPDLVIESGTAFGGSAYFLASMLDLLDHGRIMTIDVCGTAFFPGRPQHSRIEYVEGDSCSPAVLTKVLRATLGLERVLVILDSDHRQAHVAGELEVFAPLVTPGSYLVVEDTNINSHPVAAWHGPGPMEAVEAFLPHHPEYEVDTDCEKFLLTFNPRGFLRRR